jgi:hypothetical protein
MVTGRGKYLSSLLAVAALLAAEWAWAGSHCLSPKPTIPAPKPTISQPMNDASFFFPLAGAWTLPDSPTLKLWQTE